MESKGSWLVTGAGGFIGSHLVEQLLARGHRVRALVHYRGDGGIGWLADLDSNHQGLSIVSGDIRDAAQMTELVSGVEVVFHLAALIGIPYSFEAPSSYVDVNISGTRNLLDAARKEGVKAFIQTSTSEVYGSAVDLPISESHRINPQSPYAASKVGADALALSYFHSFGLPVTVLRPFNTFGPRQSTRAVIPTIIRQLLQNQGVVELGNLDARRDFTYVSDTVEGFISAAYGIASTQGRTINLGAGWDISVGELVKLCSESLGISHKLTISKDRVRPNTSEVIQLLSDNRLALDVMGWTPVSSSRSEFPKLIGVTAEWWKEQLSLRSFTQSGYHI